MSGRRCKALRRAFTARTGTDPHKGYFSRSGEYFPSEWRRVKREYKREKR